MQGEEQAERPSCHETGKVTHNKEEVSSTGRVIAACEEERATPNQSETCMEWEQAPPA